jgi:hypothetical protein
MKKEMERKTIKTHFWRFWTDGKQNKVPLPKLENKHLLNAQHLIRITREDISVWFMDKIHDPSLAEIKNNYDQLQWCERWIARFTKEIKCRQLKELPLAGARETSVRKQRTQDIHGKRKADADILLLIQDNVS